MRTLIKHKLPECFSIKIAQDQAMEALRGQRVVDIREYGALKKEIDHTRYSCIMFIKFQRGGGGSSGSGARV